MRIGVFQHGWWKGALAAAGREYVELPIATHAGGNAYAADLAARLGNGETVVSSKSTAPGDLWIDNGGTGLGFVRDAARSTELTLAHEAAGATLCSHLIDPLQTSFQGFDAKILWQSLQSRSWVKAVWDKAHAIELARFGVPNVLHLPMAAPDRTYDTRPLDANQVRPLVSFVGGQNTSYFLGQSAAATRTLLAGVIAQGVRAAGKAIPFHEVFFNLYTLGQPIDPAEALDARVPRILDYYAHKLFHHAALCIQNRDRFVIFLKQKLGDRFELIGRGWDLAYGLKCAPQLASTDDYFEHFRRTAININLVNGNAETGLNMRHFEITAAGGFMLCHAQPELAEHFAIDKECAVFHDEEELLHKINHYLQHPDERAVIAAAGQRRTLSQHLYRHRLERLLHVLTANTAPVQFSNDHWVEDCKSLLSQADVILDCGANIGQMAGSLRRQFPKAEIYCFEPVQSVYAKLCEACVTLRAQAVRKAVSDHDGRAQIHLTTSPEANSLLDYQEGNPCAQWTWVTGEEEIEVCTLDRWCRDSSIDSKRVDLIKLDVQGAELKALYGARQLLETVRLVLVEVSFVPIYKDCPLFAEVDAFMRESGYRRHAVYPSDQPHNWADALYVKA